MAHEFLKLKELIDEIWADSKEKPRIFGPDSNPSPSYLGQMLKTTGKGVIDLCTYHQYDGYGLDDKLKDEIPT